MNQDELPTGLKEAKCFALPLIEDQCSSELVEPHLDAVSHEQLVLRHSQESLEPLEPLIIHQYIALLVESGYTRMKKQSVCTDAGSQVMMQKKILKACIECGVVFQGSKLEGGENH